MYCLQVQKYFSNYWLCKLSWDLKDKLVSDLYSITGNKYLGGKFFLRLEPDPAKHLNIFNFIRDIKGIRGKSMAVITHDNKLLCSCKFIKNRRNTNGGNGALIDGDLQIINDAEKVSAWYVYSNLYLCNRTPLLRLTVAPSGSSTNPVSHSSFPGYRPVLTAIPCWK